MAKILLVDDDTELTSLLTDILEMEGFEVCEANNGDSIEVWGDGLQTRSFLLVDECVEGIIRLMNSKFSGPVNIGSEEMVTINKLAKIAIEISGKNLFPATWNPDTQRLEAKNNLDLTEDTVYYWDDTNNTFTS